VYKIIAEKEEEKYLIGIYESMEEAIDEIRYLSTLEGDNRRIEPVCEGWQMRIEPVLEG
jgi:hypothetical protein